ncbi:tyrosine-type recombinase/integrase [Mesorhizobium sp.]|uniref:tyrosine-type recombinase/integrase n=1 Tax=Mesorhizobium sp. TaxID=1871066 RepID=UPI002600D6F0|nr:tyrosine-type recombinase/integrase [Mesorhizobium sp.]
MRQAFVVSGGSAKTKYLYECTGRVFTRFLAATGRLISIEQSDPASQFCRRYHRYLAEVRGLSQHSLHYHGQTVSDFLSRGVPADRCLSTVTAADVEAFVQLKSKENNRQSLQHVIAHLRAFLRYCGDRGEAPGGLHVIDMPRVYRGELPPRAMDWAMVRRLLASIRRRGPRDWRDYAILHLMAYYGLRPSEVAALRLDSVDWEAGTLRVEQSKTRSILVLPLAGRTVRLLRRYLQAGRPNSDLPQLFLRSRSPIQPLGHTGIIEVFTYRAQKSGLAIGGMSSYSLRHAFAMRLLRRGVGVKAIGDLLGHRSLEATCVYLRADIDMLRKVALPVPGIMVAEGGDHA